MKMFLQRTKDKKFYRGAKIWKWCKSWRNAACLEEYFWKDYVVKLIKDEYKLLSIEEIDTTI